MVLDKNTIEKSKSLVWAKFGQTSLGELRLVEAYLSRINPREKNSTLVSFSVSEYSELLGIDIKTEKIKAATEHLMSHKITIQIPDKQDEWEKYVLFTYANCKVDKETGQYIISIRCNNELEPVFFEIAENGYIKYAIQNTLRMKHKFSILLYSILKDRAYNGFWEVSIQDFREQLGIKKYPSFRELNRCVIQPTLEELNAESDIFVQLEIKRVKRKAIGLRYTVIQRVTENQRDELKPLELDGIDATGEKRLLELIRNYILEKYPHMMDSPDKLTELSRATLIEAYKQLILDNFITVDNPGGYLWRILPIGDTISEYIPGLLLLGGNKHG